MKMMGFKVAREEMFKSDYSGTAQVGCAVFYKGHLLARGHNSDKTSPVQKQYNRYRYKDTGNRYLPDKLHAEILALSKIRWLDIDFSKVEVYTYRELKNGALGMARPCPSCFAFIKNLGIKKIFYSTDQGYVEEHIKY